MTQPVGVIFDMDGVLVDSAAAHQRAWQQLGVEVGTPFTAERFRRTFGQRNASIIPAWLGAVPPERFRDLDARKEALYRQFVRAGAVRVYRRIPDLLLELRDCGARLAIASSGPRANVALLIETIAKQAAQQAPLVDVVIAAEDVSEGKPHPETFLRAAERLGVRPAACAVVEDSVHGIEAAKRAAMLVIAVLTSTPRTPLLTAGADQVVEEVGTLDAAALIALLQR